MLINADIVSEITYYTDYQEEIMQKYPGLECITYQDYRICSYFVKRNFCTLCHVNEEILNGPHGYKICMMALKKCRCALDYTTDKHLFMPDSTELCSVILEKYPNEPLGVLARIILRDRGVLSL